MQQNLKRQQRYIKALNLSLSRNDLQKHFDNYEKLSSSSEKSEQKKLEVSEFEKMWQENLSKILEHLIRQRNSICLNIILRNSFIQSIYSNEERAKHLTLAQEQSNRDCITLLQDNLNRTVISLFDPAHLKEEPKQKISFAPIHPNTQKLSFWNSLNPVQKSLAISACTAALGSATLATLQLINQQVIADLGAKLIIGIWPSLAVTVAIVFFSTLAAISLSTSINCSNPITP